MIKKKKKKAQLPFRLNILFFIVFLMFSVLIIQLGVVQILNGEKYEEEINKTVKDTTKIPVPRGKIYDRNHDLVMDNKPLYSITYTPPKGVQAKDKLELAQKLSNYITMYDTTDKKDKKAKLKSITERQRKEYWYLLHEEEAVAKLKDGELEKLSNAEQYKTILKRITDEELAEITEKDEHIILIKRELDKAYSLTPQIVKNENVTSEEYAKVAEHLDELPGINATTDWNREYLYDETFKNILGNISTEKIGLPAEKLQYYLAKGYSRNDRVGTSGLEEQYEDVLRGRKEQIQYSTNKNGKIVDTKTVVKGERGKDLVLTVDMEFQEKVDEVVRKELKTAINKFPYQNRFLEDALAVVLNPQTGEILAVSGQHYDRDEKKFVDNSYRTLYDAHRPGSTVKGASVLAGYQSGVISPGDAFYDRPLKIAGTKKMGSWMNLGYVNDLDALRRSSNVYMFYIALRMGGDYRNPFPNNASVKFNNSAFQEMRNYFYQFGLGVKTGIDFPFESTGYVGQTPQAGNLLHFAIGQYDTYTPMQLAQYVATIANDGYRVRPHFLKEIRNPDGNAEDELGTIYRSKNTEVLNRVEMDSSYIKRVQEGFRQALQSPGGTGYSYFANKDYKPAGKTGTAENEVFVNGNKIYTENLSLIGYAPYDEPEIAFAVIVPYLGSVRGQHPIQHKIGEGILDTYFELKKERDQGEEKAKDTKEEETDSDE